MGRFYKTSKGNYLDFIYKQPTNLLLKAQQAADQSLAQQEQAYGDLYGRLQMNAFGPDTKKRDEILSGYEQRIEEKAIDLRNDPLKYINNPTEFRKLSNEIYKDKTRGNWASIESNAAARSAYKKKLDKFVETGKYNQAEATFLLNKYDQDFYNKQGSLGKAGDWSGVYSGKLISEKLNPYEKVDERMKGFNANVEAFANVEVKSIKGADGQNKYIYKDKGTEETLSIDRIKKIMSNWLAGDDDLKNYHGTRFSVGMPGFSTEKEIQDKNEALVNYALGKYHYVKETRDKSVTGDPYGLQISSAKIDNKIAPSTGLTLNTTNTTGSTTGDPTTNGTYSGLLANTNNYLKNTRSISKAFDANINASGLADNQKSDLVAAKNEALRTGNWDNYKNLAKTYGLPITDNDNNVFNTYNSNYIITAENNVATIKGAGKRTIDNLGKLEALRIEAIKEVLGPEKFEEYKQADQFEKINFVDPTAYQAAMQEKLKGNNELTKLFNLNLKSGDISGPSVSYDILAGDISDNITAISENGDNYEEAITYLENTLFGKDVGYLNQDDNVRKTSTTVTNAPMEILIDDSEAGKQQAVKYFDSFTTTKNGEKVNLSKVFSNLGFGQVAELQNLFQNKLPKKAITTLSNLLTGLKEGQKAEKEVVDGDELTTDGTRVVSFTSDGKPVQFMISSPKVGKTIGGNSSGYKMVYNLSFLSEDGKEDVTIEQTLGPVGSGAQVETDIIDFGKWQKETSKFNSESRFDMAANNLVEQTKNNVSGNVIYKVANSEFKDSDLGFVTVVTKDESGAPKFYIVPDKPLSQITDADFENATPMTQQAVKNFYKKRNI